MSRKVLAITLVLVLAAGFGALAAEEKPFSGSWDSCVTLDPTQTNPISAFDSTLTVEYITGGKTLGSVSTFDLTGWTDQEFSIAMSMGLLDLSSTVDFDPQDVDVFQGPGWMEEPNTGNDFPGAEHPFGLGTNNPVPGEAPHFDYWESDVALTLGGVSLSARSLLQRWDWNDEAWTTTQGTDGTITGTGPGTNNPVYRLFDVPQNFDAVSGNDYYQDDFWQQNNTQTTTAGPPNGGADGYALPNAELTGSFGSGLELSISGETPGGVSVAVATQLGLMPKADAESNIQDLVDEHIQTGMMNSGAGVATWAAVTKPMVRNWLADNANTIPGTVTTWYNAEFGASAWTADSMATVRNNVRDFISNQATISDVPAESGYVNYLHYRAIALQIDWDSTGTNSAPLLEDVWLDGAYGLSAFPYYSTKVTFSGQSLGCCDYTSEIYFTELNGFEYALFEWTMESSNWPLTLDADLKFTPTMKSIHLTPSLEVGWVCDMVVYTDLSGVLANNTTTGSTISGLEVLGFGIEGVELGHVSISGYTALGDYMLSDLDALASVFDYASSYDEVFRIEKSDSLSLTADVYFDMTESEGLFDLGLFDLWTSFALSDQFEVGTGVEVSPTAGLTALEFCFDYSW